MKTFRQFMVEAERPYDAQFMSGAQVVRTGGDGGRVGAERRKSTPERQRMRTVRNPETGALERKPASYKDRSDIGTQKPRSTREQQPTQERGSAAAASAEAIRAERRRAAAARAAAKKKPASGGTETTPAKPAASKPKSKDVEKQASELLSKAAPKPKPKPAASSGGDNDNMIRGIYLPPGSPKRPYTRAERVGIERAAARLRKDIKSGTNRPPEFYKSYLKPGQLHASER